MELRGDMGQVSCRRRTAIFIPELGGGDNLVFLENRRASEVKVRH